MLALGTLVCTAACGTSDGDVDSDESGVTGQATLTFKATGEPTLKGKLLPGTRVTLAYDDARSGCSGTSNGKPSWSTTGRFRVGEGSVHEFFAAGLNPAGGVTKPSFTIPARAGDLELWFETSGLWGCHAWDSNFGQNFHLTVEAPAKWPGWLGDASVVISRATCNDGKVCSADRKPLENGFAYDSWSRERAAFKRVEFRVWKEGVTDHDDSDLWEKLDVQLHYRFDKTKAFSTKYVNFEERVENDARYGIELGSLDPFAAPNGGTICPKVPVVPSVNGQDVTATVEFFVRVNGAELRPSGDDEGLFAGTFAAAKSASCTYQ